MSCNRADTVLHGYFDNELDALGAAEFERHLERCFECIDALESLESLCSSMNIAFSRRKCLPCFARKSSLTSALRTLSGSSRSSTLTELARPRNNPRACVVLTVEHTL